MNTPLIVYGLVFIIGLAMWIRGITAWHIGVFAMGIVLMCVAVACGIVTEVVFILEHMKEG